MGTVPTPYEMPSNGVISSSAYNAGTKDALVLLQIPPMAALWASGTQSIPNNTWTALTYDVEGVDTVNAHSTSSNTSRYTAAYEGWYWCGGSVQYGFNATGIRGAAWWVNGAATTAKGTLIPAIGAVNGNWVPAPAQLLFLAVGDYVELMAFQSSGGALSTQTAGATMSVMFAGKGS